MAARASQAPCPRWSAGGRRPEHADGARVERRLHSRRAGVTECRGHPAQLLVHLDLRDRDLRPRRGPAGRVRAALSPPAACAVRGRRRDPRRDEARAHVDGRPGGRPLRHRGVRVHRAARHQERALGGRRDSAARHPRGGAPVLLAVRVPERRVRDRHHARPSRSSREPRGDGPGRRRDPLVVDPGARREDRRDPGPGEHHVVPGRRGDVRGPVRGALRPRAREHAGVGRGAAGRGVQRLAGGATSRPERCRRGARRRDVGRRLREVPRPRWRGRNRPAARRLGDARRRGRGRGRSFGTDAARCPPSAPTGPTSSSTR